MHDEIPENPVAPTPKPATVVSFKPFKQRQLQSPLVIAAIVTFVGVALGAIYAFCTPTQFASSSQTASQPHPNGPDPSKGFWYGRTPKGMIASRTSGQTAAPPIDPQRATFDRQMVGMTNPGQTEDEIMRSHPQPPWGNSEQPVREPAGAQQSNSIPPDPAPRVSVVYDANGRPTLSTNHAYDVPPINQSPQQIADTLMQAARRNIVQPVAAQGNNQSGSDASAMVMPDVESTPGPVTIPAGSRIPAILDNAVDSDLQGPVRAHIASDVCDPRTGDVAIPRDSWLLGNQGGGIINGQRHLGIVWLRLTYPDLSSRLLIATDTLDNEGHTGIAGKANISRFVLFRDSFTTNLAESAGQIASTALAPRVAGNTAVVIDSNTIQRGVAPETRTQSWTVARNTPFLLYLERDFDRNSAYHGEKCE